MPSTLWRLAIFCGRGTGVMQRPSLAARTWWWWWCYWRQSSDMNLMTLWKVAKWADSIRTQMNAVVYTLMLSMHCLCQHFRIITVLFSIACIAWNECSDKVKILADERHVTKTNFSVSCIIFYDMLLVEAIHASQKYRPPAAAASSSHLFGARGPFTTAMDS